MPAHACMTQVDREGVSASTDPLDFKRLFRRDLKRLLGAVIERSLVIERRIASLVDGVSGT